MPLSLPFGATATSPPVCVDETTPRFRLMTQNIGTKGSKLRVTVTYELPKGQRRGRATSRRTGGGRPTPPLQLETEGEAERVARITFTAKDPKGEYLVDDLYVDPFARH